MMRDRHVSPHYKLFIYTIDQLHDTNETRRIQFQTDLQHHLRLKTFKDPIIRFYKSQEDKRSRFITVQRAHRHL